MDEEELTFGCGEGGRLIGCTFCFNSAHAECCGMGDQRTNAPRGDWACPACIDHARLQLMGGNDDDDDSVDDDNGDESGSQSDDNDDVDDDNDGDENDECEDEDDDSESDDDVLVSVEWIQNPTTTLRMLKSECKRVGLRMNGRKKDVVQRLMEYHDNL